ncbi:MAG: serine/threonine protein kinase [Planctomycetota bacterium]|nr:MAG: serine/threonine protein kinase [Planctomycetota bacterium]
MQKILVYVSVVAVAFVGSAPQMSRAEDWPMWRGPRGDGISHDPEVPTRWTSTENIVWKVALPGQGLSSPIVSADAVFVTCVIPETQSRHLLGLERSSGKILWNTLVHTGPIENQHKFNTSASSTPASDGQQVYCTFVDDEKLVVAAIDFHGVIRWKITPGTYFSKHGFAASPIVCEEGVVVNGHQDGSAFVVMLDRHDGHEIWRYKPETDLRSFSTPLLTSEGGTRQLILSGAKQTIGLNPENGTLLWFAEGPTEKVVCSPSVGHGQVFAFGGSPDTRAFSLKLGGRGDITQSHVVWTRERGMPYVPTPLLYGDYLHIVDDSGIYTCMEPKSGKVLKNLRKGGNTYSSPIGIDNKLYSFDDTGKCTVFENNAEYSVLAVNELNEPVQTTPAVSDGCIFVRGEKHLWCIGRRP